MRILPDRDGALAGFARLFFTADPHYGHAKIIEYCKRPFVSVHDMNEEMVYRYNNTVPSDGVCVWVGDCFLCNIEHAKAILGRLNGRKILVRGNHDGSYSRMYRIGFNLVVDQFRVVIGDLEVQVIHDPGKSVGNAVVIHGHLHDKRGKQDGRYVHVGVDAWGYRPASVEEIIPLVNKAGKEILRPGQ